MYTFAKRISNSCFLELPFLVILFPYNVPFGCNNMRKSEGTSRIESTILIKAGSAENRKHNSHGLYGMKRLTSSLMVFWHLQRDENGMYLMN